MGKNFKKLIGIIATIGLMGCYSLKSQQKMSHKKASLNSKIQTKNKRQSINFKLEGKEVYDLYSFEGTNFDRGLEQKISKQEINLGAYGQSKIFCDNVTNYSSELNLSKKAEDQRIMLKFGINSKQRMFGSFFMKVSYSLFNLEKNEILGLEESEKEYMEKTSLNLIYGLPGFSIEGFIAKEKKIDYGEDIEKEFKNTRGLIIKKNLFGFKFDGKYRYIEEPKEHNIDLKIKKEF